MTFVISSQTPPNRIHAKQLPSNDLNLILTLKAISNKNRSDFQTKYRIFLMLSS